MRKRDVADPNAAVGIGGNGGRWEKRFATAAPPDLADAISAHRRTPESRSNDVVVQHLFSSPFCSRLFSDVPLSWRSEPLVLLSLQLLLFL